MKSVTQILRDSREILQRNASSAMSFIVSTTGIYLLLLVIIFAASFFGTLSDLQSIKEGYTDIDEFTKYDTLPKHWMALQYLEMLIQLVAAPTFYFGFAAAFFDLVAEDRKPSISIFKEMLPQAIDMIGTYLLMILLMIVVLIVPLLPIGLIAYFTQSIAIIILFVLLYIFLIIFLATKVCFLPYVMRDNKKLTGIAAIKEMLRVSKGNELKIVATYILPSLIYSTIVGLAILLVVGIISLYRSINLSLAVIAIFIALIAIFVTVTAIAFMAYIHIACAKLYLECRNEKGKGNIAIAQSEEHPLAIDEANL